MARGHLGSLHEPGNYQKPEARPTAVPSCWLEAVGGKIHSPPAATSALKIEGKSLHFTHKKKNVMQLNTFSEKWSKDIQLCWNNQKISPGRCLTTAQTPSELRRNTRKAGCRPKYQNDLCVTWGHSLYFSLTECPQLCRGRDTAVNSEIVCIVVWIKSNPDEIFSLSDITATLICTLGLLT